MEDWDGISMNSNINFSLLLKYEKAQKYLHPDLLSRNPSVTIQTIKDWPDYEGWNWSVLTRHINVKDIENNPEYPWDYEEYYERLDNIEWPNYNLLSSNPKVTLEMFKELYYNQMWDWDDEISLNPNITFDFVKDFINEPWNWKNLSKNLFNYHRYFEEEYYKSIKIKKQLSIINKELIEKTWHPSRFFNWCLDIDEQQEIN
jgi:hypothetical protein